MVPFLGSDRILGRLPGRGRQLYSRPGFGGACRIPGRALPKSTAGRPGVPLVEGGKFGTMQGLSRLGPDAASSRAIRIFARRRRLPSYKPMTLVSATRDLFDQLKPGDRIELDHEVKIGLQRWHTKTVGTVVSTERRRHGLHFKRNPDDKVYSDLILLRKDDNELTTLTIDEFSILKKLG